MTCFSLLLLAVAGTVRASPPVSASGYTGDGSPITFAKILPLAVKGGAAFNVSFLEFDHLTDLIGVMSPGIKYDMALGEFVTDTDTATNTRYWSYYMRTLFNPLRAFTSDKAIHSEMIHPGFNRLLIHTRDTPIAITEVAGFPESKGAVSTTIAPNVPVILDFNNDIAAVPLADLADPMMMPNMRSGPGLHSINSPTKDSIVVAEVGHNMARVCVDPPADIPAGAVALTLSAVFYYTGGTNTWTLSKTQCVWAVYTVNATNTFVEATAEGGKPILIYLSDGTFAGQGVRILTIPAAPTATKSWLPIENEGANGGIIDLEAHKMTLKLPGLAAYSTNGRMETPVMSLMNFFIHTHVTERSHGVFHLTIAMFSASPENGAPDLALGKELSFRYGTADTDVVKWTLKSRPPGERGMVMTSIHMRLDPADGTVQHVVWLGGQSYANSEPAVTMLRMRRAGSEHFLFGACGGSDWVTPGTMVTPHGVCMLKMDLSESYVFSTQKVVGEHKHRGLNWVHWVAQTDGEGDGWMSAIIEPDAADTVKFPGFDALPTSGYILIGSSDSESTSGSSTSILILILIILALIIVSAIAAAVYFFVFRRKSAGADY